MIQIDSQTMLILEIVGIIFISLLGASLHFTFAWSRRNRVVGIFSAVNESVWEHLKMAFWPLLLYTGVEYALLSGQNANIFFGNMISAFLTIGIVPLVFYTYTFVAKRNILAVDISTFIVIVIIGQVVSFNLFLYDAIPQTFNMLGLCLMTSLAAIFALFTFHPPHLTVFKDTVTGKYGYPKDSRE